MSSRPSAAKKPRSTEPKARKGKAPTLSQRLSVLSKEQLVALVADLAEGDDDLTARILEGIPAPSMDKMFAEMEALLK